MLSVIAADVGHGIWNDTVGLVFTWVILVPAIATGLIVVAMISGRGDKAADDELRGRWVASRRQTRRSAARAGRPALRGASASTTRRAYTCAV